MATQSTDKWNWSRSYGKQLNKLRFRTLYRQYDAEEITYGEYKQRCFELVNKIRETENLPAYTWQKFDQGWQYRQLCAFTYKEVYDEMLNLLFGWW